MLICPLKINTYFLIISYRHPPLQLHPGTGWETRMGIQPQQLRLSQAPQTRIPILDPRSLNPQPDQGYPSPSPYTYKKEGLNLKPSKKFPPLFTAHKWGSVILISSPNTTYSPVSKYNIPHMGLLLTHI